LKYPKSPLANFGLKNVLIQQICMVPTFLQIVLKIFSMKVLKIIKKLKIALKAEIDILWKNFILDFFWKFNAELRKITV
jgi:hypothetical protein